MQTATQQPTMTLDERHLSEKGWQTPFEMISLEDGSLWRIPAKTLRQIKRRHKVIAFELGDSSKLIKCTPIVIYILHFTSPVLVPKRTACPVCNTSSHHSQSVYCEGCWRKNAAHFHVDCITCLNLFTVECAEHKQQPRHYTGSTPMWRLNQRIKEHRSGQGAKFTKAARSQGIELHLAAVLPAPKGRLSESQFKSRKNAPKYCPTCRAHS
jgi:predicted GIY-YIG superfamily endonuclease